MAEMKRLMEEKKRKQAQDKVQRLQKQSEEN
jgi:hypothetical protein